jgi:hypothetical protein
LNGTTAECAMAVLDRGGVPTDRPEAEPEQGQEFDPRAYTPEDLAQVERALKLMVVGGSMPAGAGGPSRPANDRLFARLSGYKGTRQNSTIEPYWHDRAVFVSFCRRRVSGSLLQSPHVISERCSGFGTPYFTAPVRKPERGTGGGRRACG